MLNYCSEKASKVDTFQTEIDILEANLQVLLTYNFLLGFYNLQRINGEITTKSEVFLNLVKLRTLISKLAILQSKIEAKIETALRTENLVFL